MTESVKRLTGILAKLASVIETERKAIVERAFNNMAALSQKKSDLLDEFDRAAAELSDASYTEELENALDCLRRQAARNAEHLRTLSRGVEAARETLRRIREQEAGTGAYARDGETLKNAGNHTVSTQI